MNAKDIITIINIDLNKYFDTIMINGSWGIGKTHYIKEAMNNKKFIYVSLFGKHSIEQIKTEIFYNIFNNKFSQFRKKIYDVAQQSLSVGIQGFSIGLPQLGESRFDIRRFQKQLKKKKEKDNDNRPITIIFDDLERKNLNLNIESILGFIEELSGLNDTKIIIIANETELLNQNKDGNSIMLKNEVFIYKKFKEKVIQKTFNITEYSEDALFKIYDFSLMKPVAKQIKKKDFDIIVSELLQKHNLKNLRTLQNTIPFLNEIFDNINFSVLKIHDIEEIIIASISLIVEKTENLYSEQAVKDEKKFGFMDGIYTSVEGRILKYYFKTDATMSSKRDLISYLFNIFNDLNKKENFTKIDKYYKNIYSESKDGKNIDIFYRTQEEIKKYINDFVENTIDKLNKDFNAKTFIKRLDSVLEYANLYKLNNIIKERNILKRLEDYSEELDYSKSFWELSDDLDFHFIKNQDVRKYIDYLIKTIEKKYYEKLFEKLNLEIENHVYDYTKLENLDRYFRSVDISNKELYNFIKRKLRENNYFLININEGITEKAWTWTHQVFKMFGKVDPIFKDISKKFNKYVDDELEKATLLGKYRMDYLVNKYLVIIE